MTDTAAASPEPEDRNLPAERQQHPIIAAIDARMDEIGGILPDGMKTERFRKVVVQAMLRNPALWECTPISVVTSITEAAEVGIEPTGVLGKGWLIPYRGEAKFIPGWRGFVDLCWRADRLLLTPELVRQGDEFEYRRGTGQYLHHVPVLDDPEREQDDTNVTFAYVVVRFPDGREDFEVMSRAALDRIRDVALSKIRDQKKREQAIWNVHPGEMMKKTPIRRIAKRLPLSPAVQAMLARDEDVDYDTPVERVADPRRDGLRDRIRQRTAAVRGESTEESEAGGAIVAGGAEAAGGASAQAASAAGSSTRKGDPWMARLHAVGAERGMDHDALHDWAVEHFGVESLTDLIPPQRATFMELVERMEVMPTSAPPAADQDAPASAGAAEDARSAAAPIQTPEDDRSTMAADPATAAGSGGEGVPPAASSEPAPAPSATAAAGGEAEPVEADDPADRSRITQAAADRPDPTSSSPAASISDPASLETFAAGVLGFEEPQPLKDLTSAEFDEVWASLGLADLDAYRAWYPKQERAVRAALMTAKQSPTARRDAAKDAAKAKPDADQLRASLDGGS